MYTVKYKDLPSILMKIGAFTTFFGLIFVILQLGVHKSFAWEKAKLCELKEIPYADLEKHNSYEGHCDMIKRNKNLEQKMRSLEKVFEQLQRDMKAKWRKMIKKI